MRRRRRLHPLLLFAATSSADCWDCDFRRRDTLTFATSFGAAWDHFFFCVPKGSDNKHWSSRTRFRLRSSTVRLNMGTLTKEGDGARSVGPPRRVGVSGNVLARLMAEKESVIYIYK
uniref:Putative secreted protein n=1 Tax=Ixodes ricinus TaxID=34613 RepID=A0A6B0UM01_IXORI